VTNPILADIQKLDPGVLLELIEVDATALGGSIIYFHAGMNVLRAPVVWQGKTYSPWPVDASGFEWSGRGQLPTPHLKVANIAGTATALALAYDDLVGAKVTRRRTMARYLDAVNFPGGVNANADPTAGFVDDIFYVERKVSESRLIVEWELRSAIDVEGIKLPRRQVIAGMCLWVYRSAECGYAGGPVATINDAATSDPAQDRCGKRLASCKFRFGAYGPLPFGGFPGVGRY
jgi:lambda family phage minor tail protein L